MTRCEAITLNHRQCRRNDGHLFEGKHYCTQHLRIAQRTAEINRRTAPPTVRTLSGLRGLRGLRNQETASRVRTYNVNGQRLVSLDDLIRILNSFDKNNPGLLEEVLEIYGFQRLPDYSSTTLPAYS